MGKKEETLIGKKKKRKDVFFFCTCEFLREMSAFLSTEKNEE